MFLGTNSIRELNEAIHEASEHLGVSSGLEAAARALRPEGCYSQSYHRSFETRAAFSQLLVGRLNRFQPFNPSTALIYHHH